MDLLKRTAAIFIALFLLSCLYLFHTFIKKIHFPFYVLFVKGTILLLGIAAGLFSQNLRRKTLIEQK